MTRRSRGSRPLRVNPSHHRPGIDQASTAEVVTHFQSLADVEHRFRVMKYFLGLRPVYHRTEQRVRGHISICVLAAVIEAVIADQPGAADISDPDLPDQTVTPRRAWPS